MFSIAIAYAAGLFSGAVALCYLLPWIFRETPTKAEMTERSERREFYRRHYAAIARHP